MSFPVDADRITSGGTTTGTFNVSLPTGIQSGNILILVVSVNGTNIGTHPSEFTQLGSDLQTFPATYVYWKAATGSEGSTVSVTSGNSKWASVCWRITGGDTGITPSISNVNFDATGVADPPSLSPSGGSKEYLWVYVCACNRQPTMPPSGTPSGYSNPVGVQSAGSGGVASKECAFGASKQATAATEDAPSWTTDDASAGVQAWTVAIHPGEASPEPTYTGLRSGAGLRAVS